MLLSLCDVFHWKEMLKVSVDRRKSFLMSFFNKKFTRLFLQKRTAYKRNRLLYTKVVSVLKKK